MPVLYITVDRIEREIGLQSYLLHWSDYGSYPEKAEARERPEPLSESCEVSETAMMLQTNPDLVRRSNFKAPQFISLMLTRSWWGARYGEDFTNTGLSDVILGKKQVLRKPNPFSQTPIENSIYALKKYLGSERKSNRSHSETKIGRAVEAVPIATRILKRNRNPKFFPYSQVDSKSITENCHRVCPKILERFEDRYDEM